MLSKTVAAALVALAAGTLTACATTDSSQSAGGTIDARHQHLRDAKQGPAASSASVTGQPVAKLLHDHREMK